MKIYIAGKITGDPEYKDKFARAEAKLRETHEVDVILNPADLPEGMQPGDYMQICLAMLDVADAAVFLPDWGESAGAGIEMQYCRYTGKPVYTMPQEN